MHERQSNIPARIPPQAVEVEEAVLGSAMIESEAADLMFMILGVDDFYKPAHRLIYESMRKLYDKGQTLDLISIESELRDRQKIDDVGGSGYLADLTRSVSSSAEIEYHCAIIRQKAIKRDMIIQCNETIKMCYQPDSDAYEVVDQAQSGIFSLVDASGGHMRKLSETITNLVSRVQEIQENGVPIGLRTGLDLDKILSGFQNGKFYVIGARPSMGKTALVMTIMRRFARDNVFSAVLSLETSDESLATRLVTQVSELPADRITSGQMNEYEVKRFLKACEELFDLGIYIDDESALTAQKVRSKCRLLAKKGARAIFVDFLQLMVGEGRTKHEEIGKITKTLKHIAKELNIPIIALSQLSRKVEDRTNKRPQLSDLRESGSIEEDADGIMFIYRPEYYGVSKTEDGRSTEGLAEIIVAKNKDGKTGRVDQRFIKEYMRFENPERYHPEPEPVSAPVPHHLPTSDMDDESPF